MTDFHRFYISLKNAISNLSGLKCSLLKKVLNKPSNSATGITLKINGGTTIFNGVLVVLINSLFFFTSKNKKSVKWLRILNF